MAKFIVPRRVVRTDHYIALRQLLDENPSIPESVEFDFSWMTYIEPPGVAFLGNLARWFLNRGVTVTFSGMDVRRQGIKYLDDSQFFEQFLGSKIDPESRCRNTTLPLQSLAQTNSHAWLDFEFVPWLSGKSGLNSTSLAEVRTCIKEIINNINDHTEYDEGCIFSQWYPKINKIKFSIADFGCGIRRNAEREMPGCTDAEAIKWASRDGTTSKSLPSNRGAGLYLLLQNIVEDFNGIVTITSGYGRVEFVRRDGSVYGRVLYEGPDTGVGYCIGTSIDITLMTDNIPHAEDEEDFDWQF